MGATDQGWSSAQSDFEERVLSEPNRPEALLHTAGAEVGGSEWVLEAVFSPIRAQMRIPSSPDNFDAVVDAYEQDVIAGVTATMWG